MVRSVPWKLWNKEGKWFQWALVLFMMFLLFTAVYATGIVSTPTLQVEQLLLLRPQTRIDCVFYEWRNLGNAGFSMFFLLIIGVACLFLGYRKRILPCLLLLLLISVGAEIAGKSLLYQPEPYTLRSGMETLTCPQMHGQSGSVQLATGLGIWGIIPHPYPREQVWAKSVSRMPLVIDGASGENSYPSGHAIRWTFIGLVLAWLFWRHVAPRRLRLSLVLFALTVAFVGGFMQFYIGVHFITDTLSGYLLGAAVACCAIGILRLNEPPQAIGSLSNEYRRDKVMLRRC